MSLSIWQEWLQFRKAVSEILIWLAKKTTFTIHYSLICLVRQGWKGNCFERWVKTLKCAWHQHDAGELALLELVHNHIRYNHFFLCSLVQLFCFLINHHVKVRQHASELTSGLSIHRSNYSYWRMPFYLDTKRSLYRHESEILNTVYQNFQLASL